MIINKLFNDTRISKIGWILMVNNSKRNNQNNTITYNNYSFQVLNSNQTYSNNIEPNY